MDQEMDPLAFIKNPIGDMVLQWDGATALQMIESNKKILENVPPSEINYREKRYKCK